MTGPGTDLSDFERLRVGATIASYLLAPNQGEHPDPVTAKMALDVALGFEDALLPKRARERVEPYFRDPFFLRAAGINRAAYDEEEGSAWPWF